MGGDGELEGGPGQLVGAVSSHSSCCHRRKASMLEAGGGVTAWGQPSVALTLTLPLTYPKPKPKPKAKAKP